LFLLLTCAALAQNSNNPQLVITPPERVSAKAGGDVTVTVSAYLNEGFHLNSHTPPEAYLIPLTLAWTPGPLTMVDVVYPKPQMLKTGGSDKPLSVLTGKFEITTKFKVSGAPGPALVLGKLRYQACNDRACFPPKLLDVRFPVDIH
jgi:hypothetical protein